MSTKSENKSSPYKEIDTEDKSTNVMWHQSTITRKNREDINKHKSVTLWFTGLSGSGKSTLAHAVEDRLHHYRCSTFVLDGDNVRHGLCGDLGFSDEDRKENIRRVGNVAKLFLEAGVIVLTAFISPFKSDRELVRNMMPHGDFLEIYCKADIEVCEQRDVKGLYKKAREGAIKEFTGISSPYEEPVKPEILVNTGTDSLDSCVDVIILALLKRGIIRQESLQNHQD
jgi:adenylylsulfate kinase